jgi:hypothetical protein
VNRAALKRGPARDRSSPETEWLSRPGLLERDRYSMIGRRVGKWAAGNATRVADPPDGQRSVQLRETEQIQLGILYSSRARCSTSFTSAEVSSPARSVGSSLRSARRHDSTANYARTTGT